MSEMHVQYRVQTSLKYDAIHDTMPTEMDTLRADLEEIERRLIPLLVTVQRALGKEPMILTRAERRGR